MLTKKQKIAHAITFVMIIVLLMGGVNYYIDSYAQVRISYTDIAKQLKAGNNVAGLAESRYNERYLAVAMIELMEEAPECVILGSSRSQIYGKEYFGTDSFYNFSLSGGSLDDYYGIIGYLADSDILPKRVIIEVNGSLFNEKDVEYRATYLQGGIDYLKAAINGEKIRCEYPNVGTQYQKLLAIDYFKYNLQCLFENTRFSVEYTDEMNNVQGTKLADGSSTYPEVSRNRTDESVEELTGKEMEERTLYKIEGYKEMSLERMEDFEKLVGYLLEQGIEVELFLPVYSQPIYDFIKENEVDYKGVLAQEEYIVAYAKENKLNLYGSYSPEECNLSTADFMDPYHIQRESGHKTLYLR